MEHTGERQCLTREGSGNTGERQCLSSGSDTKKQQRPPASSASILLTQLPNTTCRCTDVASSPTARDEKVGHKASASPSPPLRLLQSVSVLTVCLLSARVDDAYSGLPSQLARHGDSVRPLEHQPSARTTRCCCAVPRQRPIADSSPHCRHRTSWLTTAVTMDSPCCSCKLTRCRHRTSGECSSTGSCCSPRCVLHCPMPAAPKR